MIPFNRLGILFKSFASLIYPQQFRRELTQVIISMKPHGSILDAGAGTGILSRFAWDSRKDLTFTLLDLAPGMLRHGPAFARKVVGNAESLPFCSEIFDAVLIGDAVHHFFSPEKAAGEIRRVLKPGGMLIIFEIDPERTMGKVIARGERTIGEPARFYPPRELAAVLAFNGFQCSVSEYGWRYAIFATKQKNGTDEHTC